jgi:hypothetical protein
MTAFLALFILICTLSLGVEGIQGSKDAAHPATVDTHEGTFADRTLVCRYGEGASIQRDLSSPTPPAGEAAPMQR